MNSPIFLSSHWGLKTTHARDSYNTLWREIFRYGGADAADRVFLTPGADNRNVARFRRAVELADEYWIAYEESAEAIDAVPLYYGSLSLGNALSYATLGSARVAQRTKGHGLSVDSNITTRHAVLNAKIHFGAANDAFGMINESLGGDPLVGSSKSVLDLIRALPELSDRLDLFNCSSTAYEVNFTPGPRPAGAATGAAVDVVGSLRRPGGGPPLNMGYVRDTFAISSYLEANSLAIVSRDEFKWAPTRPSRDEIANLAIRARGAWWLLPRLNGNLIPEYCLFLAVLYALSVFARYIPEYWLKMREDRSDEWFLIRDFMDIVEEKVPRLALNHFTRQTHDFIAVT